MWREKIALMTSFKPIPSYVDLNYTVHGNGYLGLKRG